MKLQIKKVIPETVDVWHDEYGFIGEANEYEFGLLRIEIKRNELEGYYVLKNGTHYHIDKNGNLDRWDFFTSFDKILEDLLS